MGSIVTPEEKARFNELNRIRMKVYRDRKRVRKYSPRPDKIVVPKTTKGGEK